MPDRAALVRRVIGDRTYDRLTALYVSEVDLLDLACLTAFARNAQDEDAAALREEWLRVRTVWRAG